MLYRFTVSRGAPGVLVVLVVLTGLAAVAADEASAEAAVVVSVRARTRIEIDKVAPSGNGVRVSGRIVEAGSDAPLGGLPLFVTLAKQERMVTTNRDGSFRVVFPVGLGRYFISARYLGDDEYAAFELPAFDFDVGKPTPQLTVTAPSEIEAGQPFEGAIEAGVGGEPVQLALVLLVGDAASLQMHPVAQVQTDDAGRVAFSAPATDLGGAGEKRVRVIFPGNDSFNQALSETTLRILSTTRIDGFHAPAGTVAYEDTVEVAGRLVDEAGQGVAAQTIAVSAGGERVGGARTADDGSFRARLKASRFAPGGVTLSAEYVSTTPWRRGARTPPVTVTIAEPRPVPIRYTIGAFALTFAVVIGFVLARTRPWLPLWARWQKWRRHGRADSGPVQALPGADPDAAPQTGLRPGRPTLMQTLRRPADAVVSGSVRDVLTNQPLAGVRLDFSLEGQPVLELVTDEAGRFEVGPLHAGTWKAHARAAGYVTERFSATCPHRGELRDVRIDLMPVREQVFVIYRGVALRLLPRRELWGVWTPREILDHVRKRRPTGALGELTSFVEEAYFSARVPDESVLPHAQRRAAAAKAELGTAADT